MKKKSIRTMKKKVWHEFSKFIRLRDCLKTTGLKDYGNCITCGQVVPRSLLQAGHFIIGRHNANLFSERGVNAQCYNCNINLKGNTLEYRRKIIEMYGEGADIELEKEDRETKKFTIPELEELLEYYKEKIEELDNETDSVV